MKNKANTSFTNISAFYSKRPSKLGHNDFFSFLYFMSSQGSYNIILDIRLNFDVIEQYNLLLKESNYLISKYYDHRFCSI